MNILFACPANTATGGPESIHKIVCELAKIDGINAKILYVGASEDPCPIEYKGYHCDYVIDLPEGYDGWIVFPEIWANDVLNPKYKRCHKAVLWLSVDLYATHTPQHAHGDFLKKNDVVHLVECEYAKDYLKRLGVDSIKVSDVLNDDFFEDYTEGERDNTVLYNPAKATEFQFMVMHAAEKKGIHFKAIEGMSRSEVIQTMRSAKLFIDFGTFPGRERLPREAAMCGCCVITGTLGAAAFHEDVVIQNSYKFNHDRSNISAIVQRMLYVLEHYDECRPDFDEYRQSLINDRDSLPSECVAIVEEFKKHEI